VITEHEGATQQAIEDYEKLFVKPLSDLHLEALAVLFNWALLTFEDQDRGGIVIV
jgi:hypothetical protein